MGMADSARHQKVVTIRIWTSLLRSRNTVGTVGGADSAFHTVLLQSELEHCIRGYCLWGDPRAWQTPPIWAKLLQSEFVHRFLICCLPWGQQSPPIWAILSLPEFEHHGPLSLLTVSRLRARQTPSFVAKLLLSELKSCHNQNLNIALEEQEHSWHYGRGRLCPSTLFYCNLNYWIKTLHLRILLSRSAVGVADSAYLRKTVTIRIRTSLLNVLSAMGPASTYLLSEQYCYYQNLNIMVHCCCWLYLD